MATGKMIVIEGIEGAGKSTAIEWVKACLSSKGIKFICTREPGGTKLGETLRNLLKGSSAELIEPETELLLMYASRVQLFHRVIKPALNEGIWVISDRFELSSFAYQGVGRNLGKAALATMSNFCLKGFKPDLTLYMDVPYEISQQRLQQRGIAKDRIEQESAAFFNTIREAYCTYADEDPSIKRIDAAQTLKLVQQQVLEVLSTLW